MSNPPVINPARFVPLYGVGYADNAGELSAVSTSSPLPVSVTQPSSLPLPVEGAASATAVVGPFAPALGVPVVVNLSGSWGGTVQVKRSTDGGTTFASLTAAGKAWANFTGNACEAVWEENNPDAALYLDIQVSWGTVDYRMGH
ncbi:MAG: hypothetical protein KDE55_02110 [Novosphingobium sp.]|nr:hypothetical protein [Novosphingobium sp.]